jgi:integrase
MEVETVTERLTPERLGNYICAILAFNRASTVRCRIIQLSYMAEILMPEKKWAWIRQHPAVPTEAEASAVRKDKQWCDPSELIAKSLSQCDAAAELPDAILSAVRYRDGVMIPLAYCCVVRRKNLSEMRIGSSVIITPEYIRIVFDESDVKNDRVIDVVVPDFLCPYLREYVQTYRPVLLQGGADTGELWINKHGKPLSYDALYGLFTTRSEKLVQQHLHPHSTRYSLATSLLDNDPRDIDLAADSLGHRGTGTVARFYNQAGSARANAAWQQLWKKKSGGGK